MKLNGRNGWKAATALAATLAIVAVAGSAQAYPYYDDNPDNMVTGTGCVNCHAGFQGGNPNLLHQRHILELGITTAQCNICHSNGGGTMPVKTYKSGAGFGYGCVGCHGQDYGETVFMSPVPEDNGTAKASGWGLRRAHANAGVTVCEGCHGATPMGNGGVYLPESSAPPYYQMAITSVRNPCDSHQEDWANGDYKRCTSGSNAGFACTSNSDCSGGGTCATDSVGLDNDGNGQRDYPADISCAPTTTTSTTTSTTTTTLPAACNASPLGSCIAPASAKLSINDKSAGKEKIKAQFQKLAPAVLQSQFGDPVTSDTSYVLCVYNASDALVGEYSVSRGGDTCDGKPCWAAVKDTGYKYQDKLLSADGISKIQLGGGDPGKGKVSVQGKNKAPALNLPSGVAAALNGATSATAQFVTSDGFCVGATLSEVKTADGSVFSGGTP